MSRARETSPASVSRRHRSARPVAFPIAPLAPRTIPCVHRRRQLVFVAPRSQARMSIPLRRWLHLLVRWDPLEQPHLIGAFLRLGSALLRGLGHRRRAQFEPIWAGSDGNNWHVSGLRREAVTLQLIRASGKQRRRSRVPGRCVAEHSTPCTSTSTVLVPVQVRKSGTRLLGSRTPARLSVLRRTSLVRVALASTRAVGMLIERLDLRQP